MREHPEKKKTVVDWGIYKVSGHFHILAGIICLLGVVIIGRRASAMYAILWVYFVAYLIVCHLYILKRGKNKYRKVWQRVRRLYKKSA